MRKFAFANMAFLTAFLTFPNTDANISNTSIDVNAIKLKNSVSCTPDREAIDKLLVDEEIPLMPGSGNYKWKINTLSDSAQLYFNQGINMYYGFHIIEAIASFKKAATFDASNPMVWWARALAYGPNINDTEYKDSPDALMSTQKAVELSSNATPEEKALINAMATRYSSDSTKKREVLNQAYVDAMKDAVTRFPNSIDIITLYADALMLQHPWDLWTPEGTPKPWQPEIQTTLEKALKMDPMHPGANHYYIHIVEASPTPEKAIPSADILGQITPGLSHLVHMPSHIYLRTGQYNTGVNVNDEAVRKYKEYAAIFPASGANAFIYYWHNLHMLANCAMLAGRYNDAMASANELYSALDTASLATPPPVGSFLYYMLMTPMIINTRFEKWDAVLATPKPDDKYVYANILYHFGIGMANAAKNNFDEAKKQSDGMQELMKDESLKIPMSPFSPVIEGANVALGVLDGYISLKNKNTKAAIEHFTKAAEREWKMVYTEPRDWMLNPYHYLGTAYLADKNFSKAEAAFREDLKHNANNVWSLDGLEKSLRAQNKKKEADKIKTELKKAAEKADSEIVKRF